MRSYTIIPAGDAALVVDFGDHVDLAISAKVIALAARFSNARIPGVIETVPTIRSLSVYYEPLRIPTNDLKDRISQFLNNLQEAQVTGRTYSIPVCYHSELAPDLDSVAQWCGLSAAQVIELHSSRTYHVYMLGFLPGLAYLGDLPDMLILPRRDTPRPKISEGSLGIAGKLTCIYPRATPCGWHVIGRSPVALWDQSAQGGALLKAGDKVRFNPISQGEYERIRSAATTAAPPLQPTH